MLGHLRNLRCAVIGVHSNDFLSLGSLGLNYLQLVGDLGLYLLELCLLIAWLLLLHPIEKLNQVAQLCFEFVRFDSGWHAGQTVDLNQQFCSLLCLERDQGVKVGQFGSELRFNLGWLRGLILVQGTVLFLSLEQVNQVCDLTSELGLLRLSCGQVYLHLCHLFRLCIQEANQISNLLSGFSGCIDWSRSQGWLFLRLLHAVEQADHVGDFLSVLVVSAWGFFSLELIQMCGKSLVFVDVRL